MVDGVCVTARCQRGSVLRSELHTCCRQIRSQAVADRERSTFTHAVRFDFSVGCISANHTVGISLIHKYIELEVT